MIFLKDIKKEIRRRSLNKKKRKNRRNVFKGKRKTHLISQASFFLREKCVEIFRERENLSDKIKKKIKKRETKIRRQRTMPSQEEKKEREKI